MPSPSFPVDPARATSLTDARLQTHHAAQLLVAAGISYLPHQPDDSHTNLGWLPNLGALASRTVPSTQPFRLALQIAGLTLHVLDDNDITVAAVPLGGQTVSSAAEWLRAQIAARGADAGKFTLAKHYTIPAHAVDSGAAFNATDGTSFEQLARWYGSSAEVLEAVRAERNGAEVRCWPHHFDIATLLDVGGGTTIGIGMEPGDASYDEPYYYVNLNPRPAATPAVTLAGGGIWHTKEWFGAVLRGSDVSGDAAAQRSQVYGFINSALVAYGRRAA